MYQGSHIINTVNKVINTKLEGNNNEKEEKWSWGGGWRRWRSEGRPPEKGHLREALKKDREKAPWVAEGRLLLRPGVPTRFADSPQGQCVEGM